MPDIHSQSPDHLAPSAHLQASAPFCLLGALLICRRPSRPLALSWPVGALFTFDALRADLLAPSRTLSHSILLICLALHTCQRPPDLAAPSLSYYSALLTVQCPPDLSPSSSLYSGLLTIQITKPSRPTPYTFSALLTSRCPFHRRGPS